MIDLLLNGLVTLFVIVDPLGLVPLFISLTPGAAAATRRAIAWRACLIAFATLSVFALTGMRILEGLGITLGAFRVAGGLFLFWIGFELVFEKRGERKGQSANRITDHDDIADIASFPLAIPLIAGPGAISAVILISGTLPGVAGQASLIVIIACVSAATFICLVLAHRIERMMGVTGRAIISRLLGVLLAALAVQFVADGAKALVTAA